MHTVDGKVGKALSFDGSDDYIDLPDGFSNFTNGFSASFWIYPTANQNDSRIFDIGQGKSDDNIRVYRAGTTSQLNFDVFIGSSSKVIYATDAITNNEWQHFVVTIDSNALATIYKNGIALTSGTIQLPANVNRTYNYVGRSDWSSDQYYAGYIDELVFFSGSINQAGVNYLYNNGLGQNLRKFMGDFSYNTLKDVGTYTTNLESLPYSADYSVQSYIVDNSGTKTTYEDVKTFTTLTPNIPPAVESSGIVINEYDGDLYAGQSYSIETIYSDGDGSSDLNTLYLKLDNPDGDDIEMYGNYSSEDLTDQTPTISSGSSYISNAKYSITPSYGTDNEVKVTWSFDILWNWTESTDIGYGIKAIDLANADSTYSYTNNDYIYENDLTFIGTLSAENSSSDQISSESWILPNESVTLSGLTVVYENTTNIYPLDKDFNVTVTDNNSNIWADGISSGESFSVSATTGTTTSEAETFSIDITGIPTGGNDISDQSFNFKIDATNPAISDLSSTTHLDSNKWYNTNIVRFIWEAIDLESGIEYIYRYLSEREDETSEAVQDNGTVTTLSEWTSNAISNGIWHFYLLAEDIVGNISFDKIYVKIDISTPDIVDVTGSNENVWQNRDSGPSISWTDPDSLSDDMFYISTDGSTPSSDTFEYATNQITYNLPDLGEGEHSVKVIAKNGAGTYSDVKEFVVRYDPTPTGQVGNFSATVNNQNNVQLTWTNPSDNDFTKVIIKRNTSVNYTNGITVYEGNNTSFTDTNLNQLSNYFYTIIAYDKVDNASEISTLHIKTKKISRPAEVKNFNVSKLSNGAKIEWLNPDENDFDKIILKRNDVLIYEGKDTSFTDILTEKGKYLYTIVAYDTFGNSSKENSFTFDFTSQEISNPVKEKDRIKVNTNEIIEIKIPVAELLTPEQIGDIDRVILQINGKSYEMTLSEDKQTFEATAVTPSVKGEHTITAIAMKNGEVISAYDIPIEVTSNTSEDNKSFFIIYRKYIYIVLGLLLITSASLLAKKVKIGK